MDTKTILALNSLNEQFYNKVGVEFDRTRQQYWEGWLKLVPHFNNLAATSDKLDILDVACGNARFGRFAAEYFPNSVLSYLGLEREPQLLSFSEEALANTKISYELKATDIIQSLMDDTFKDQLKHKYNLIMMFGLMHHVPSQELRNKLIQDLGQALQKGGLMVITSWQFALLPRFTERFANPELFGIDKTQLEENDYILDWQRVEKAYRYCHYADKEELIALINDNTDCTVIDSFYADGKTHQLNCYAICRK